MSIHAALTHRTTYRYDRRVSLGPQIIRLRPAPHARTPILSYSMKVSPAEHFINWQQDPFGNWLARLVFPEKTDKFEITVDLTADMAAINPFDFFLEESAFYAPFTYDADTKADLAPYLERIPGGARFDALVQEAQGALDDAVRAAKTAAKTAGTTAATTAGEDGYRTVDFLVDLNRMVQERVSYAIRMEPGVQTPEETLERAIGSCRDSGWLLVALLRRMGYAARFVSGYLIQLTADEEPIDGGPSGPSEDFTDLHAWCEVYAPGAGWIGLDPTSGLFAGEGHIPLAATPAPQTAAAVSGAVEKSKVSFDFGMDVRRVYESPRVSKPMSDQAWAEIDAAGRAVDAALRAGDVRLTMGGEPTFIADFDRDAEEWNTEAVGPTKRRYADQLARRLRERFAPGGLLTHGQGKWYPGEQLPRWAFGLYWRRDGAPLWGDEALIANEAAPGTAGVAEAARFTEGLAEALEVGGGAVEPLFEDPAEFMLRERRLAPNLDPLDNKLDDLEERTRLSRVFDRGLETPCAFVLPIQAAQALAFGGAGRRFRWRSERWRTRRGRLFLLPGDSPAGFRLPLRSLTYLSDRDTPNVHPFDPFAPRGPLPWRPPELQSRNADARAAYRAGKAPGRREDRAYLGDEDWREVYDQELYRDVGWVPMEDVPAGGLFFGGGPAVRTAITIEPRDGRLSVFLPPVATADEYVDLVQAIEETAAVLGQPVQIEGYPPPSDHRIESVKVTPDPGVIEVNIHPTASWDAQVAATEALYEEARQCGLVASKFMLDGRPTGSGGGAHVVVGGARVEDSPFLRRPDLLGSLIRFWQNHPSLSYLFSGLFIGPTSQAPRIDEARHDSLYELEIALGHVPDPFRAGGLECPPWLVDRLFRNLLVDVSGNTHRAEICIDKLYSPDGPTGRLGLVEFRGFEMPPHPRMNLAQQLILRGLIAWFWREPYKQPLKRFGTELHDAYLLPHYVWEDFREVLALLSKGLGVRFDPSWFDAQLEFRFPRLGAVSYGGVELELRSAIEPWPVMGEEGAVGGTTRFVDSSVERLQVKISGEDAKGRLAVACNSWRLPLTPLDDGSGDRLAAVRYRTWWPASCLHPTVPPHGPLVFDIVDTLNGRSLGGCTYHSTHPGGRNFELQPVNALEAEGRRRSRFETMGHHPGPFSLYEPRLSSDFPRTLDMRAQHGFG